MKLAVKILKYFLVSFFVLSVASSQSYTQAEVLEMIKERDLQWQGKVDNANNLIASQKEVIDDSDRLIKELESQVKTDSLLLLKKSEQIEILKERDEANQKMIKLVKPKIWEHRYLWFAVGIYLGKLL
jgi:16S rRNA U516 pseudouridylate synthase RsuA-like enzyme|tara:strand:+ start:616 stop:999 length:384 start_codon:yes stop_codon:yes gene_type:complete